MVLLKRHGGIDYVLGRGERHTDSVAGATQQEADRVSIAERNTSSCATSADLMPSASASHRLVVIVDVSACNQSATDQGAQIAQKIEDRVPH